MNELIVIRPTATNYIDALVDKGFLEKQKIGRSNFYINMPLYNLFKGEAISNPTVPPIKPSA